MPEAVKGRRKAHKRGGGRVDFNTIRIKKRPTSNSAALQSNWTC